MTKSITPKIREMFTSPESLWRAGMFGSVAFFILAGIVFSTRQSTLSDNLQTVSHSHKVIHSLDLIVHTLVDTETAQRGYLITGDELHLDLLAEAKTILPQLLKVLEDLVSDDPAKTEQAKKLTALSFSRMEEESVVLKLWRDSLQKKAVDQIRTGLGSITMEKIRTLISEMKDAEHKLIFEITFNLASSRRNTETLVYMAGIIILLVIALIFYLVHLFNKNEESLALTLDNLHFAKEALQRSEGEFRSFANSLPLFVWVANKYGEISYFNDRWFEYEGMDQKSEGQKTWADYVHPDDFDRSKSCWEHCLKSGEPFEIEYRLKNKQDQYRWFIGRAVPIFNESEAITQWFGTCTDIHDNRRLGEERELILNSERHARDQAEKATRAKDEFVATLSHELRGPLNSIMGWLQIINSNKEDAQLLARGMEVITRNTQLQTQLISDLFDFHLAQTGKLALEIGIVNLSDLINSCADSILPTCEKKNITIIRKITCDVCEISGDGNRLSQIVMNLLNNSVKFTPENESITITLGIDDNIATIEIKDSGVGIDQKVLPYIFDRYNQGSEKFGKRGGGLGLGLSIAKSFATLHHGSITASSDGLGKGSTFTVTIPCDLPSDVNLELEPNSLISQTKSPLSELDILIVEDQADAREALVRILLDNGARIRSAESGEHALLLLKEQKPDIMLSDISMPGMDGYTLMEQAVSLYPTLVAIATTAFSGPDDQERARAIGFVDRITKPLDITALISSIQRNVNRANVL